MKSDTEYPDHVHECLKHVAIHRKGAFSCSSPDDEDDDEDVKRILAKHGGSETEGVEAAGFSTAYAEAARAAAAEMSLSTAAVDYEDWDEATKDVGTVYPALGFGCRGRKKCRDDRPPSSSTERGRTNDEARAPGDRYGDSAGARELRKRLEGALYGGDTEDFVVAQPYCTANKNLDFGKPIMSRKAVRESKKKVEIWMNKYAGDEKPADHY